MSHDRMYQRLREHLAYLKVSAAAEVLATRLDRAQRKKPSYTAFLEDLLRAQVAPLRPLPRNQAPGGVRLRCPARSSTSGMPR
jgi:hypothetical protein